MRVLEAARQIALHGVKDEHEAFRDYVQQRMKESTSRERELWSEMLDFYDHRNSHRSHQVNEGREKSKVKNKQLTMSKQ